MKNPTCPKCETYKTAYEIEKNARIDAENLLEDKTRSLYFANRAKTELFYAFTTITHEDVDLKKMLEIFITAICKLCVWPVGHIFIPAKNNPNDLISLDIWYLDQPEKYRKFQEITMKIHLSKGIGLPGRILETGMPVWIEDILADPNFPRAKAGMDIGVRCAFAIPIWSYGKIIAIAEFFSPEKSRPDADMMELVNNAAKQLSLIIEQRESYNQAKENYQKLKITQAALEKLAHFDPLTGLANRLQFEKMLKREIYRANRLGSKLALLYIDLDNFKKINDSFGHDIGNALLKEVAQRLQKNIRVEDIVARLSGDEFVVGLVDIKYPHDAGVIAKKIVQNLSQPYNLANNLIIINTASVGVACYPEAGTDESTLYKNADIAMYNAKISGRNNYRFFTKEIHERHIDRLDMENDLRFALRKNELFLVYQPEFDLQTNKIIAIETLLRWQHPTRGLIYPDTFIPIAEEMGLMISIGEWVIKTACEQYARWRKSLKNFKCMLAINVSASQLRQRNFCSLVLETLSKNKISPKLLQIELTENIGGGFLEKIRKQLVDLSKMGISLTIDDYGTGYSTLNRLKDFPIRSVKIDKSFIRDLNVKMSDNLIVKSTIDLAKDLGLNVIAEGVETKEQLKSLIQDNCPQAQGYYYSRPLSTEGMEIFLNQHFSDKGKVKDKSNKSKTKTKIKNKSKSKKKKK